MNNKKLFRMPFELCEICCDNYYHTKFIDCTYCNYKTCYNCVKTYVTSALKEANCMACKKIWSYEFVIEKLTPLDISWTRHGFQQHIGKLIMEQEKTLLPSTQKEANLIMKIRELSQEFNNIPTQSKLEKIYKKDPDTLELRLIENKNKRRDIRFHINEIKKQTETFATPDNNKDNDTQQSQYIMKCPTENCRGFISNDDYKCGICDISVCEKCHMANDDKAHDDKAHGDKAHATHACKKEDILSAEEIKNSTKPCPKCMTPIWKISGCDQMFCTQCHTSFSWLSGNIENRIFHNPHFYEWLANSANNPINIEEIACGELPGPQVYIYKLHQLLDTSDDNYDKNKEMYDLTNIYRMIHHIDHVMEDYSTDRVKTNFDLRVKYLTNDIDEDTWCMKLMNRDKKRRKVRSIRELLELYNVILTDMVRQITYTQVDYTTILKQYRKLKEYHFSECNRIMNIHGGSLEYNVMNIYD